MSENKELTLFSEESERAVLSLLLQNPLKTSESFDVKAEMFSSVPHQILFRAIQELSDSGTTVDQTILTEYLKTKNKLEEVGSISYIEFLGSRDDNIDNFKQYEKMVIDSYRGRSILNIVHKLPEMVRNSSDIMGVIDFIKEKMSALVLASSGDRTISLREALKEQWKLIKERLNSSGVQGKSVGFTSIDYLTNGANAGDLFIIAGRPSQGKTAWMLSSALKSGQPSLIVSKEMGTTVLVDRILSIMSDIPFMSIRQGTLNQEEVDALGKCVISLAERDIFIDTNFSSDLSYILNTIRRYVQQHDISFVYIDYVQLVAERDENATHEIGKISRALKLIANELGITVFLLSQLNRLVESRDNKRPILSDLRQSGNLEEDADVIIFLYRDEYYNEDTENRGMMENIIRKNRNGAIGTVFLQFKETTVAVIDPKNRSTR